MVQPNRHGHKSANHPDVRHFHSHETTIPWPSSRRARGNNIIVVGSPGTRRSSFYAHSNRESLIIPAALLAIIFIVIIASALLDTGAVVAAQGSLVGNTALGAGLSASVGFGAGAANLFSCGILYLVEGAIAALFAGNKTFNSDKPWNEALKDVVYFNRYFERCKKNDKGVFTGVFIAMHALLLSPFLLIGGLGGLGVKACVEAYREANKTSLPIQDESSHNVTPGSYSTSMKLMNSSNHSLSSLSDDKRPSDPVSSDHLVANAATEQLIHVNSKHLAYNLSSLSSPR